MFYLLIKGWPRHFEHVYAARRAQVLADSDQDNESIILDDASDLDPTEHWEQQAVSGPQLPVEASDFFISLSL